MEDQGHAGELAEPELRHASHLLYLGHTTTPAATLQLLAEPWVSSI